jgi:hypothetical protein
MRTTSIDEERRRLTEQVLSATTLPEIATARCLLEKWLADHPEEEGMRAGFEQLAHMEEIAEMEAAAHPLSQEVAVSSTPSSETR